MVNDKMCVGVETDRLMVRFDPSKYDEIIEKEGCSPMDFTGRVMKGFVFVKEESIKSQKDFNYWISLSLAFNKKAKASKPKRKKKA